MLKYEVLVKITIRYNSTLLNINSSRYKQKQNQTDFFQCEHLSIKSDLYLATFILTCNRQKVRGAIKSRSMEYHEYKKKRILQLKV